MEEWRDIKGYEGLYQVSSWGRVKSFNYKNTGKEGIFTMKPDNRGYLIVTLYKNEKRKHYSMHKLVAEAFIPNPNNLPYINHKDEDKTNNYVENLEWCTPEYNNTYGTKIKRQSNSMIGNKNPRATKVKCITTNEIFNTIKEASEKYNINHSNIGQCCENKRKSAGKHPITGEKLVWEYV